MTTSIFKIVLREKFDMLATREVGAAAREYIIGFIIEQKSIDVDLDNAVMSPSFADECFGGIAGKYGAVAFREHIHLKNVSPTVAPLLKHVISRRAKHAA